MEYSGYNIAFDGSFGYHSIKTIGRGSTPADLKGRFTTVKFAQRAIDTYLQTKKAVKDGKNSGSDRG